MKRTVFVFASEAQQTAAKDYLLRTNTPFYANLTYPYWLDTTAKRALKLDLPANLQYVKCYSNRC
ncbi:hypothetical protein [Spirosoma sp.]|uniref:hypothetical protein n=1 Tax=Spirosoma sp. TaxID=1899569 RepID=UPI0026393366|nr:hypothetical protein [Spirosoma sp.]MCX6217669.1 hypothetical protein [Spirosoma sp.]